MYRSPKWTLFTVQTYGNRTKNSTQLNLIEAAHNISSMQAALLQLPNAKSGNKKKTVSHVFIPQPYKSTNNRAINREKKFNA